MNTPNDLFYRFIEDYEQGHYLKALQSLVSSPDICYDTLAPKDHTLTYLINDVDASIFKGALQTYSTHQVLRKILLSNEHLALIASSFIEELEKEEAILYEFLTQEKIDPEKFSTFLLSLSPSQQDFLQNKFEALNRWNQFKQAKPLFGQLIEEKMPIQQQLPWRFFSYPIEPTLPLLSKEQLQGSLPMIYLQPLQGVNYQQLLAPYLEQKLLFIFHTTADFLQFFQFPELLPIFTHPDHALYILDLYPQTQWRAQIDWKNSIKSPSLYPLVMLDSNPLEAEMTLLKAFLEQSLNQSSQDLTQELPKANDLYHFGKNLEFSREAQRYGASRLIALNVEAGFQKWYDPHKGPTSPEFALKDQPSYFDEGIRRLNTHRISTSKPSHSPPWHLVHVVPQITDGGHAPTKLLTNLVSYADREKFKVSVISTEKMVDHFLEYPIVSYSSEPSELRGKETLALFHKLGTQVYLQKDVATYEQAINQTVKLLHEWEADIVVFHGADEIHAFSGALTDTPKRVLFDHGTLPPYPSADYVIFSTEEALKKHREAYLSQHISGSVLNFCMDAKAGWLKEPYSREELGLPSSGWIMTTISNHLEARLGQEMCLAIQEILQRCPDTYYAPIGPIHNEEKLRGFFSPEVQKRVIFLGSRKNPSQYARSMDLYLNEFPFGSGLGMLDAMAAGCPVVSMYDPEGPQQSLYGATYFGIDRVIRTGKREDYVALACKLFEDEKFYEEWSEHAKKQYEKHADVKAYVQNFEKFSTQDLL